MPPATDGADPRPRSAEVADPAGLPPPAAGLPAVIPAPPPLPPATIPPALVPPPVIPRPARWRRRLVTLLVVLIAAGGIGAWWWLHAGPALPPGIFHGNGRLEADEVDIDTKYAGRILELHADEGDLVKAGQVVAVMDTRDMQALLGQAQDLALQNERLLEQTQQAFNAQQAIVTFNRQEVARTTYLVPRGFATQEMLDQRTQQLQSALATLDGDQRAIEAARHALDAARHQIEYYGVQIADSQLFAPKDGPIEYRVANVGEVLPAGGRVFTMLDASYVYMDIYLPTRQAGRVRIGADARIVLDAYPSHPIPARVVFVASQAQFTPKMVETRDERDKLMFRIRMRIDPDRLAGHERLVRSGLPGDGYVRTDPATAWPPRLAAPPAPPPDTPPVTLPSAPPAAPAGAAAR